MIKRLLTTLILVLSLAAVAQSSMTHDQAVAQAQQELEALLARYGGLDAIQNQLATLRTEILIKIVKSTERYVDVKGQEFQAGITGGSMAPQWPMSGSGEKKSGYEAVLDLHNKLHEMGVDLIFVPVPSKFELYPDVFDTPVPSGIPLNPARIDMLLKLAKAGVEVVDILPTLQAHKADAAYPLYEVRGHHLSSLGAKLAGELVASRLERYRVEGRDTSRFGIQERKSVERVNSKQPMNAFEVTFDGAPYEHVNNSPFTVIGDSQAFAHFTAGWASHIARASGVPITDLSLSSGGSWAAERLGHLGRNYMEKTKVVVWIVTSSALNVPDWKFAEFPEEATVPGLMTLGLFDEASARVKANPNPAALGIDESYVNEAAYRMVATRKPKEAEAAFLLNTQCFPTSANAWDSLAEFYARMDRKDEAILAAKKSLGLDPAKNVRENTIKTLKRLGQDTSEWEVKVETIELTEAQRALYVGSYLLSQDTKLVVTHEDAVLKVAVMGRNMTMLAVGEHHFNAEGLDMTFSPSGDDMLLSCKMGSQTREGKRVTQ